MINIKGFMNLSSLDLNMGYYHIEQFQGEKHIYNIILPWGKYQYQKLPMFMYNSHDIFQYNISKLFEGFFMVHTRVGPAEKHFNLRLLPVSRNFLQVNLTCSLFYLLAEILLWVNLTCYLLKNLFVQVNLTFYLLTELFCRLL